MIKGDTQMKRKSFFSFMWIAFFLSVQISCAAADLSTSQSVRPASLNLAPAAVELDVPYVPTPMRVVRKMLNLAEVGENDIVYDLGSGDGRIVITAAKERGARGVGIDMNPERIRESKANAAEAQVGDRVTFLQQDLFQTDISEATVLTLYLLRRVNLEIRPKILYELRPGTRVVSHAFDMGEWEPDQVVRVGSNTVFYWVVPANVSGVWEWTMPSQKGSADNYSLRIDQQFQHVSGTVTVGDTERTLQDSHLEGNRLEFTVEEEVDGSSVLVQYEGRVNGDNMEGVAKRQVGQNQQEEKWKAVRDPATVVPIDQPKKMSVQKTGFGGSI
jgi:SAM-dependent methyltransferase